MIVTERFVFIHMHKTGGQTLNDIIADCIPDHRVIGYHYPRRLIPQQYTDRPVIGFVRNPYAWYVSWYSFNRQLNIRNSLFHVVSEGGQADFSTTVSNLASLGSGEERSIRHRGQLIDLLPETLDGNRGAGLTKPDIRDLGESGSGYLSWLFDRMVGIDASEQTLVGRFENLRDDFLAFMRSLEVAEADAIAWAMDYGRRKNTSRHSHYSHYYTDPVRELIADREQPLLGRFGYGFERVGPSPGALDTQPATSVRDAPRFQKLLGAANNYLKVNAGFEIDPLRRRVEKITDAEWAESGRDEHFHVHRDTRSVTLIEFIAHKDEEPRTLPLFSEFEEFVQPVIDHIAEYYQDNGFVIRILLAKLLAGCRIEEHVDSGYSLLAVHRVHVPVITNDKTLFSVGGEPMQMRAGEFWEIDNSKAHAVQNLGDSDRVHMIVDWMPNPDGLDRKAAIDRLRPSAAVKQGNNTPALDQMIAQAYQYQREGKFQKAEARYRYVLDIDPDHPVGNNLMGMLCRQQRRYDEAVGYIQSAIRAAPKEARSHANLGQAYLMLGQFEDSARSFQSALNLDPQLESARVGLQRAQSELGAPQGKPSAN